MAKPIPRKRERFFIVRGFKSCIKFMFQRGRLACDAKNLHKMTLVEASRLGLKFPDQAGWHTRTFSPHPEQEERVMVFVKFLALAGLFGFAYNHSNLFT